MEGFEDDQGYQTLSSLSKLCKCYCCQVLFARCGPPHLLCFIGICPYSPHHLESHLCMIAMFELMVILETAWENDLLVPEPISEPDIAVCPPINSGVSNPNYSSIEFLHSRWDLSQWIELRQTTLNILILFINAVVIRALAEERL